MPKKLKLIPHEEIKERLLQDDEVRAEFNALMKDFDLVSELIRARLNAKKTQSDVALAMDTTTSVVSRLESMSNQDRHSPTLKTLKKYAAAVGCEIQFKLQPIKKTRRRQIHSN